MFRCYTEFCVTMYNEKGLNSVQTWLPGFSAMYHYTKFDMASAFWLNSGYWFDHDTFLLYFNICAVSIGSVLSS